MGQVTDIITYEGNDTTAIWKHPADAFVRKAKLIVPECYEAVLMVDGNTHDVFGKGSYTLDVKTVPMLAKALNRTKKEKTPFNCNVYYVNNMEHIVNWGQVFPYRTEFHDFPIRVALDVTGTVVASVYDSRRFLLHYPIDEFSREQVAQSIRRIVYEKIAGYFMEKLVNKEIDVFNTESYFDMTNNDLLALIQPIFSDYGMQLDNFSITNIGLSEETLKNKREIEAMQKEFELTREKVLKECAAKLEEAERLKKLYEEQESDQDQSASKEDEGIKCSKCAATMPVDAKFCGECGSKLSSTCPRCGANVNGAKFCGECGIKL